ncbi:MAG: SIS domain-containing protein [Lachnospiraceae bacterium]|nr:SIS domain-containing protein [Lachnospiraceae bacterium]
MIKYFEDTIRTIENSLESVSEEQFNRLVEDSVKTLETGHKIIASGLGKNVPICEKFVGTMLSLGKSAFFLHTNSAIHGDMGMVQDGDLVIILTKSGETAESVYLANQLKKRNVTLWLLTFKETSTLTKMLENSLVLNLEHEGDMWNIMPNNSTTLNLIVLQAVAMNVALKMNVPIEDFKRNHPGGHIGEVLKDGK